MVDSAQEFLDSTFSDYGLPTLISWAWEQYKAGVDVNVIMMEARKQPEWKARFPAMEALAQQGKAISALDYINYEKTVAELSRQYGIPQDMYATADGVAKLLTNGVSPKEANDRFQMASAAAYSAPAEVRTALRDLYGLDSGSMIAYWLDPDKAMPLIERQYQAAQITGAAYAQQMSSTAAEAERLAAQGVSYDSAVQGFGQASQMAGLDAAAGEGTTRDVRVAAAFGDTAAQTIVTRVQKSRAAAFSGGGGPAASQDGVTGLGKDSA